MLLNYLTTPHVLIWSASVASCALPGIFEPTELLAKNRHGNVVPYMSAGLKWQDGSMQSDLPMTRLGELFNVNFFIVSQVNPQARVASGLGAGSSWGPLVALAQFLLRQVKDYMLNVTQLFVTDKAFYLSPWLRPGGFTPVALMVQKYTGDITVFNGAGFMDMHRLLENGTHKTIVRYTAESERETWKYIEHIKNACAIEFVMDEIIHELRAELLSDRDATPTHSLFKAGRKYSLLGGSGDLRGGLGAGLPSFIQMEHPMGHTPQLRRAKTQDSVSVLSRRRSSLVASHTSLLDLLAVESHSS